MKLVTKYITMKTTKIRTYSELCQLETFEERFEYLRLNGLVSDETFGSQRYVNQQFYKSPEWRRVRNQVIVRDAGCDLGIPERELSGKYQHAVVHHMNPIVPDDIINQTEWLLNPEYLITTCAETHKAIHYGNGSKLQRDIKEREPYDLAPWKKKQGEDCK